LSPPGGEREGVRGRFMESGSRARQRDHSGRAPVNRPAVEDGLKQPVVEIIRMWINWLGLLARVAQLGEHLRIEKVCSGSNLAEGNGQGEGSALDSRLPTFDTDCDQSAPGSYGHLLAATVLHKMLGAPERHGGDGSRGIHAA